ncbi:MAG: YwiC-like family protein [Thermoanaerobaculia bacterium]
MTVTSASPIARVSIRPLALPVEHGGWGFVLEPVALALVVAPSWPGVMIGIGVLAAFLARHPLRLAAGDWMRRRRYPRTIVCERLAVIYGAVSIAAMVIAVAIAGPQILLPFAIAAPFGFAQFAFDVRNHGRAMTPEIIGAAAAGASAASIALAGGRSMPLAATLWLLMMLRSIPSIVFVRAALKRQSRSMAIAFHVAAVVIALILWRRHLAPVAAIVAMLLLLMRALMPPRMERPQRVGMRELAYGVVTLVLIGAGFRF